MSAEDYLEYLDGLDLNPLLVQADPGDNPRYCKEKIINKVPETLDEKIWKEIKDTENKDLLVVGVNTNIEDSDNMNLGMKINSENEQKQIQLVQAEHLAVT